jgi:N-formylglutamate deformylase
MSELPYIYIPPDGPMSPLVVNVPHAGTIVPESDRAVMAADERTMLRDADLLVDRIYADAAPLGATYLVARISRYVLDLNRAPTDVDPHTVPGLTNYGDLNPRGLFWRESTDGTPVNKRPLTITEYEDRVARIHRPYHERLRTLLEQRRDTFGYAILLDGHSMPSVGRKRHTDPGRRRPDVVPGNVGGSSCAQALTDCVVSHFEERGFSVSLNDPYSGGYITRTYGRPADGIHAIQVELNRALYLHEDVPSWAGVRAARVVESARTLVSKLLTLDLSQVV